MSIVALKRKSRRFQAPISGRGKNGFSLVGGHRNVGVVGTTNLAKSVTRTTEKFISKGKDSTGHIIGDSVPRGWGGCCNTYKVVIHNSGSCCCSTNVPCTSNCGCTNDSDIIKPTVKNTAGMLANRYRGIYHGAYKKPTTANPHPVFAWVQSGLTYENSTQGTYVDKLTRQSGQCNLPSVGISGLCKKYSSSATAGQCMCKCCSGDHYIGAKKFPYAPYTKNLGFMSSSEYQKTELMKENCLPTTAANTHFPNTLGAGSKLSVCRQTFKTIEEAKAAGWPWK
jgi:hypothetical protein